MYDYVKVINGITKYVDVEIVEKINGWQKWVVGSGLGIALSNSTNIFNKLKENEIIKMLDIIDKEDKIDVDKIYIEMKKQAQKSAITFDVPMLGALTLNEKDVDKIYEFIKEDKSA
jgi:uncharacterized protein YfbU (UPF0304 family)